MGGAQKIKKSSFTELYLISKSMYNFLKRKKTNNIKEAPQPRSVNSLINTQNPVPIYFTTDSAQNRANEIHNFTPTDHSIQNLIQEDMNIHIPNLENEKILSNANEEPEDSLNLQRHNSGNDYIPQENLYKYNDDLNSAPITSMDNVNISDFRQNENPSTNNENYINRSKRMLFLRRKKNPGMDTARVLSSFHKTFQDRLKNDRMKLLQENRERFFPSDNQNVIEVKENPLSENDENRIINLNENQTLSSLLTPNTVQQNDHSESNIVSIPEIISIRNNKKTLQNKHPDVDTSSTQIFSNNQNIRLPFISHGKSSMLTKLSSFPNSTTDVNTRKRVLKEKQTPKNKFEENFKKISSEKKSKNENTERHFTNEDFQDRRKKIFKKEKIQIIEEDDVKKPENSPLVDQILQSDSKNPYDVFKISKTSRLTLSGIRRKFNAFSKKLHPDKEPSPGAHEAFIIMRRAYMQLKKEIQLQDEIDKEKMKTREKNTRTQTGFGIKKWLKLVK